ncbi:hypothetical protein SAMN05518672_104146 [Chitinophaga sp. CF118]|uniref:GIN domain-containing protein n=1 Tax=Chitinophaga sp. CF118 TaxID=1884367 RepID=UPI0008E3028D|nr:DUF2807 domain-containing protein [Chitinophaga sp. CF118]SFE01532.1 hypothetical protein SAMN05518672_104146 [Chitinophaga sp. CF118]
MKLSTIILITLLALLVTSLFASNLLFKRQYDHRDKSDLYWNYNKILERPFKHLKVDGGNVTNIVFMQSKSFSVRVLDYWGGYQKDSVKAYVNGDTLHIKFLNKYDNLIEKSWMQNNILVRVAAPELLSIEGHNTNLELDEFRQKSLTVRLSGKSRLEVESNIHSFDQLEVTQNDSTQVVFEMNPDLKGSPIMHAKKITVRLKGVTLLDMGHLYTNQSDLLIADSSALILSGKTINSLKFN